LLLQVSAPQGTGLSDAELLERYVERRDEAAIETLLWRHGPMVLRTCWRLLGSLSDAEDCFQATFLVLCRDARSIARRQSLGSWLYKVAYRVCLRARTARQRQPAALPAGVEPLANEPISALACHELRAILDEELGCLPEKYRAPLVLHYLEGKTVEQVAAELGWPCGTVCVRLTRGKDRLRNRLAKRGMVTSAGAVAVVLAEQTASASLTPAFVQTAVRALITGAISRTAESLAQGFMRAQLLGRLKLALTLLIVAGGTAAGTEVLLTHDSPETQTVSGASFSDPSALKERPMGADPDGDPLPRGAIRRLGGARFRHGGFVHAMAYSSDGRTLTTTSGGGVIRVWDAATGQPRPATRNESLGTGAAFALSTDGSLLATDEVSNLAYDPGPVKLSLSALLSRRIISSLEAIGGAPLRSITISRDGKRVAAGGGFNNMLVWEIAKGKLIRRLPLGSRPAQCERIALSHDGKLLAARDNRKSLRLWDVESGHEREPLLPDLSYPTSFDFSCDGRVLACGDGRGQIRLWNPLTGKLIRTIAPPNNQTPQGKIEGIAVLAISSDSTAIATAGDEGSVRLWGATSGELRAELVSPTHTKPNRCRALAFSPDNRRLAVGGESQEITIWDVATGNRIAMNGEPDAFPCYAAVSPNGDTVATTCGRKLQLWDTQTGRRFKTIDTWGKWLAFSPDGSALASPGASWDLATGKPIEQAKVEPSYRSSLNLSDSAGRSEAEARQRLWWIRGDTQRPAAISPDGQMCAWPLGKQGAGAAVILYETISGQKSGEIPCSARCWSAAFCPDGQTIAVAGDDFVELREVPAGRFVRQFVNVPPNSRKLAKWPCQALAVSPDGELLAANDGWAIRVWDIASGQELEKFSGHNGQILSLAFFPDSRRLISGSEDTTALIWDVSQRR
jgi:RNA polymerase sigma factor (sigma-70 family)